VTTDNCLRFPEEEEEEEGEDQNNAEVSISRRKLMIDFVCY
jgi:hypothetical protein